MNWQGLGFAIGKWALWNSAGAALVAVLVMIVQYLLGNRISARWRHNLWMLVAVRLMLPALPGLAISMPQWLKDTSQPKFVAVAPRQPVANPLPIPAAPQELPKADSPVEQFTAPAVAPAMDVADEQPPIEVKSLETAPKPEIVDIKAPVLLGPANLETTIAQVPPAVSPTPTIRKIPWNLWALTIWLAGALQMLARLAFNTLQLRRLTRTFQPIDNPDLHELLADCCRRARITRPPKLVKGPSAFGPALIGLWRPRLTLPARVLKDFGRNEIRAILFHELIHLRRRDVAINYLIALLQAAHWFNPLVWIAFYKIRAERELACDEAVLALSPARERLSYGCMILKLLETLCDTGMPAGAVGVVQQKRLVQRRINMIARFNGERTSRPITAMLLSALVAGAALTATSLAQDKPAEVAPKQASPPSAVDNARAAVEAAAGQKLDSAPANVSLPALPEPAVTPPLLPIPVPTPSNGAPTLRPPQTASGVPEPMQIAPAPVSNRHSRDSGPQIDYSPRTIEDASATIANANTAERLKHLQPLDANGLPLREVLHMIADVGKVDIVTDDQALANAGVDPNVAVNIRLRDPRPLEQILEMSLRLASPQVDYAILDGVIFVTSRAELNDHTVSCVYDIGNADHATLSELLISGTGLAPRTTFVGNKLVVTASELTQRHVAKLLSAVSDQMSKKAEGQTSSSASGSPRTMIFALKYAEAPALKSVLATACSPGCFLAVDGRTNSLIIKGTDDDLTLADVLIRQLDAPPSKVEKAGDGLPDWAGPRLEALRSLSEQAQVKARMSGPRSPAYRDLASQAQVISGELENLAAQLRKDGNEPTATRLERELKQINTFLESRADVTPDRNAQSIDSLVKELAAVKTKLGEDHPQVKALEERLKIATEQSAQGSTTPTAGR